MNAEMLEKQWPDLRGRIRTQWSDLTEGDIDAIDGMLDRLVYAIQQRYGWTHDAAASEVAAWQGIPYTWQVNRVGFFS